MPSDAHRAYHEYLLGRMADVLGLKLDREVDLAHLTRAELERAVARCSDCPDPSGCELWLDEHPAGAQETPRLCRNRRLLEHLRGGF